MTVRLLQSDGDITTSGTQFTTGVEEVAQTVRTRLKLFLGEYFRDITDGTPWFESVLGKGRSQDNRDAVIRNRIRRTDGVLGITDYSSDFDLDSREYSVTCGILTSLGSTSITVSSEDIV